MSRATATDDFEPILACTVSHDIEDFGLLFEDMEGALGEAWGDLRFDEVLLWLDQPDATDLQFLVFALDEEDIDDVPGIALVIAKAHARGVRIILVAEDLPEAALDQLREAGVDTALGYPCEEGELARAIAALLPQTDAEPPAPDAQAAPERDDDLVDALTTALENATPPDARASHDTPRSRPADPEPPRAAEPEPEPLILTDPTPEPEPDPEPAPTPPTPIAAPPALPPRGLGGAGRVIAVQGLSGGCGATTLAVNLAQALTTVDRTSPPSVCLIDLDLQFGMVASYLDLIPRAAVIDLLSDIETMDSEAMRQSLQRVGESGPMVMTIPADLVPLDFIRPADVARLIEIARAQFDYVIIDMPRSITDWTESVLTASDLFFAVLALDLRSAQNCVRFREALQAEGLGLEKLRYVLNRTPGRFDLSGRGKVQRMTGHLKISSEVHLPDGGSATTETADQGEPLVRTLPKTPLAKAITALATDLHRAAT